MPSESLSILHVTSGFRPWIVNGLVIYVEELMAAQAARGHRVDCFFPGRHYPVLRRPFLHGWRRDGVRMHEWINSPLVVGGLAGTPFPEAELAEPRTEAAFARVLRRRRPDLVHVHDLGGVPSSLVEVAHAAGIPAVMSLLDYFALCPTVRLYDVEGNRCLRQRPGHECARCCSEAPHDNAGLRLRTIDFEGKRARRRVPGLAAVLRHPGPARALASFGAALVELRTRPPPGPPRQAPAPQATPVASPRAYDRRREVNVQRLNEFDLLIAHSARSARVFTTLGVSAERMRRIPLAAYHIERLRPSRVAGTGPMLTFAAIAALTSRQKGADVVVDALARLRDEHGLGGRFRLLVLGPALPETQEALRAHPEVVFHGSYDTDELDGLLDGADVGLVPSVWEETFGLTARECLAKALPVIATPLGGLVEAVDGGRSGWLTPSPDGRGLAQVMAELIRDPEQVVRRSEEIATRRHELIMPMARNADLVAAVYREALDGRERANRHR